MDAMSWLSVHNQFIYYIYQTQLSANKGTDVLTKSIINVYLKLNNLHSESKWLKPQFRRAHYSNNSSKEESIA